MVWAFFLRRMLPSPHNVCYARVGDSRRHSMDTRPSSLLPQGSSGPASSAHSSRPLGPPPPSVDVVQGFLIGLAAGVLVGLLRFFHNEAHAWLTAQAHTLASQWPESGAWTGLLLWALLTGLVACGVGWLTLRYPQISGSGIPHVESVLRGQSALRWWPTLWTKFVGTVPVLCAGLSVGREGPSIQLGAVAAQGVARLWGQRREPWEGGSPLPLMAGAGAGLSAAFGAPLAGVIVIFEEMRQPLRRPAVLQCLSASLTAWAVCRYGFRLPQVLPFDNFTGLLWGLNGADTARLIMLMLLLGVTAGLGAALYNKGLLATRIFFVRLAWPQWCKPLAGFLPVMGLFFLCPLLLGGGEEIMMGLLDPWQVAETVRTSLHLAAPEPGGAHALLWLLALLLVAKYVFILLSYCCGVPGGLLMPLLCLGALLGAVFGQYALVQHGLTHMQAREFIVFGMAGAFAGIVRAPLTGVALCVEMSGAWACLPGLLLVAAVAEVTARAVGAVPVYEALGKRFKPLSKVE